MVRVLAAVLILLPLRLCGQGQSTIARPVNDLHYYFTLYSQADGQLAPSFDGLNDFLIRTDEKRNSFKSEKAFVYFLFSKTHQNFFRRFQEYASFRDLVSHGIYNCLTGSALMALLLDHHDIEYKIIETNYHVFLLLQNGTILLETTDVEGFVDDPARIRERISKYQSLGVEKKLASKTYYEYPASQVNAVSNSGMLGLLHYNQAVKYYNEQKLDLAIAHLRHALLLHRTANMETFVDILIETVRDNGLYPEEEKRLRLERLKALKRPGNEQSENSIAD
jgi:hypothetical protein